MTRREAADGRLVIVGLPNTGKSQRFSDLTGQYALVANYPLTTVEPREADVAVDGRQWSVMDTPGIQGLYVQSEEDALVRRSLVRDRPVVLLQCIDARRLKQSLALTADLAELGLPMVVSLNGTAEARGVHVDAAALERVLGVPVVVSASPGEGAAAARDSLARARPAAVGIGYGVQAEAAVREIERLLPATLPFRRKTAQLLLQGDERILGDLEEESPGWERDAVREVVARALTGLGRSITRVIAERRDRWVDQVMSRVAEMSDHPARGAAETFGWLSRHPVYGLGILGLFLGLIYLAVVHLAGALSAALNRYAVVPAVRALERVIPAGFWRGLLIGDYGVLTLGVFNALCTVLPILLVFFLVFGAMEDIGYLPNLTVLSRRLFSRIGLTGNSVISLVLGFGCKTMATLTTRSLRSRKERLIAVYLIAFAIPCSAQLGLDIAILGRFGVGAFVAAILFLALVELAAGLVLNAILPADQPGTYLQELPPIRAPRLGRLLTKTGHRLVSFFLEAMPVFVIASLALFVVDLTGVLDALKVALRPVITGWLGLPLDVVDALILSMARHEAAAGLLLRLTDTGQIDAIQAVVAVSITTMFVPCIANIVSMFRTLGAKAALVGVLAINITAFALAGVLNQALILIGGGRWL